MGIGSSSKMIASYRNSLVSSSHRLDYTSENMPVSSALLWIHLTDYDMDKHPQSRTCRCTVRNTGQWIDIHMLRKRRGVRGWLAHEQFSYQIS